MKHYLTILLFFISFLSVHAGIIPEERTVDWSLAGYRGVIPDFEYIVNIIEFGADENGVTNSDNAFKDAVSALNGKSGVVFFPTGEYLFEDPLTLRSNIIIRGDGAESSVLKFRLNAKNVDCIRAYGTKTKTQASIVKEVNLGEKNIQVESTVDLNTGDYIQIKFDDKDLVVSDWAVGTVGQIVRIEEIKGNQIELASPVRMNYSLNKAPYIEKINMVNHIGIECLTIINETTPGTVQTSTISFKMAAQSWINGVETYKSNFAHVLIDRSSNITVRNSYFQDAHAYGGGGQGYGVVCQMGTTEAKIEANIFKHLRHSMLLQAGANGNVYGYNYSTDAFWTGTILSPKDAAGDMVLHGNYVYANLFEGNIVQNIVIDDSHGKNGPYNTFFRNRAELYGIFMNNNPASDAQNFVGNEITNNGILKGLYTIAGKNHFQYADNVKGSIKPSGTNDLSDITYYLDENSAFYKENNLPLIGLPNKINTGTIPAKTRYMDNHLALCEKEDISVPTFNFQQKTKWKTLNIYPNPTNDVFYVEDIEELKYPLEISIFDTKGQLLTQKKLSASSQNISVENLPKALYFVDIIDKNNKRYVSKLLLK